MRVERWVLDGAALGRREQFVAVHLFYLLPQGNL